MAEPIDTYFPNWENKDKKLYPRFFEQLISLHRLGDRFHFLNSLDPLPRKRWIFPILLGSAYRVSRALSARKGGRLVYFDAIDTEERDRLLISDGQVVLDCIAEVIFARDELFDGIHEGLAEAGLPADRVWIINHNMRSEATYLDYCKRRNQEDRVNIVPFNAYLWLFIGNNSGAGSKASRERTIRESRQALFGKRRGKAFVSLNGRLRPHRLQVVLFLLSRRLMEKGHVSFLAYQSMGEVQETALRSMVRRLPFSEETTPFVGQLMESLPMSLDVVIPNYLEGKALIGSDMTWSSPSHFYLDSYFSIIVDTTMFDAHMLFITVMVYKSIMNCHPFIYFGNQGALRELRRFGFQTFHPFIDESYDDVEDAGERMRLALLETERLANLSIETLHDLYCELWPRLEHNFNQLWIQLPPQFAAYMQRDIWKRMNLSVA